tara:strand:+ start:4681 stop:7128 length:2448 start_codon:yes stop_codon:yes gene_type:complete
MNNLARIEKKWQRRWEKSNAFYSRVNSSKKKFYNLEMLPYPSGTGLHLGHARNYSIGDSIARYKRMQGFNVIYPMGWDSFGLPSENEAIKRGVHPTVSIKQNIATFKRQMKGMGLSYDWDREIATHNPDYYKWNQWLFLKLLENGLAYRKKTPGNWCPGCQTTLANEDVKDGECWRCDSEVVQKEIQQWFFRITKFSDGLLKGLEKIDWSPHLKSLQRNWIGRSEGIEIKFKEAVSGKSIPVFTTRPDTLFGCTYVVLAPEHPLVKTLVSGTKEESKVNQFLNKLSKQNERERISKEKEGLFIGRYAINPVNNKKIPIFIANFVLMGYGTGAIMSVPAHDSRDYDFAKKYKLPIKTVIQSKDSLKNKAYSGEGKLVNSGKYSGLISAIARERISKQLSSKKLARKKINYKIRDWNISRQRYWGTPIPIVYCDSCGMVPIPERDLPVKLPRTVDYNKPAKSPLDTNASFVNTNCPSCKGRAKRETDTMGTFVDSAWYFFRYCDPNNKQAIFDKNKIAYWMPVDQYIGGTEHAVGHLLYARFITKFLKKIGYVNFDEPFLNLLNQGMVNMGGSKMSKSKGNVIDPLDVISKYSADTLRTYLLFIAAPETAFEWSDKDIRGVHKVLKRIFESHKLKENNSMREFIDSVSNKKIVEITNHFNNQEFNKAIISLMDFFSFIEKYPSKYSLKIFLRMFYPIAPHVCEEVWENLGNKTMLAKTSWPEYNKSKVNKAAYNKGMSIEKIVEDVRNIVKIISRKPKSLFIYTIPNEAKMYDSAKNILSERLNVSVTVFASNDPNKIDPDGKAKKAKPGKPGIYLT